MTELAALLAADNVCGGSAPSCSPGDGLAALGICLLLAVLVWCLFHD